MRNMEANRNNISLLPISFDPVMRLAEHLTIRLVCGSPPAPGGDVVGIHLALFPDAALICSIRYHTERAVGYPFRFGLFCLLEIDPLFCPIVKETDIQQPGVLAAAQHILINSFVIVDRLVHHQFPHLLRYRFGIIGLTVVLLVKLTPLQTPHIFAGLLKDAGNPVDHAVEICL